VKSNNNVIVKISGGLGNQMFQYAFYKKCIALGYNASTDISYYDKIKSHNGFELNKIFQIDVKYADPIQVEKLGDFNNSYFSKIRRALLGDYKSRITEEIFSIEKFINLEYAKVYFDGYWQSELFFHNIADKIKADFEFKLCSDNLNLNNQSYLKEILSSESVSIHVRRGDYLKIPLHYDCCNEDYYSFAIQNIKKIHKNAKFFIFSDDIPWCMKNFENIAPTYVSGNAGDTAFWDMYLMSKCKHNIIANSTFSWWGAWLNENLNKTVTAPKKWFNDESISSENIIPDSWIKI
jgi:hypothetical protein